MSDWVKAKKEVPDDCEAGDWSHLRTAAVEGVDRFGALREPAWMHWRHALAQAHAHARRHRGDLEKIGGPSGRDINLEVTMPQLVTLMSYVAQVTKSQVSAPEADRK